MLAILNTNQRIGVSLSELFNFKFVRLKIWQIFPTKQKIQSNLYQEKNKICRVGETRLVTMGLVLASKFLVKTFSIKEFQSKVVVLNSGMLTFQALKTSQKSNQVACFLQLSMYQHYSILASVGLNIAKKNNSMFQISCQSRAKFISIVAERSF